MTTNFTIVETLTGLFTRNNLTLNDPPLMSINCTSNCGDKMIIRFGRLEIDVRTRNKWQLIKNLNFVNFKCCPREINVKVLALLLCFHYHFAGLVRQLWR